MDLVPASSNINEVIRGVLNSSLFFYEKILHPPKAIKVPKAQKAQKAQKRKKAQPRKSTKRY